MITVASVARGELPLHPEVRGPDIETAELRGPSTGGVFRPVAWDDLGKNRLAPGGYQVRVSARATDGDALELPHCGRRGRIDVDGKVTRFRDDQSGPVAVALRAGAHVVTVDIVASEYEKRIACGARPRLGRPTEVRDGLGVFAFPSPHAARGGGEAVFYVPPGHDTKKPAALLLGLHPWNGSMWTYAAYAELLREARARDVLVLLPSGLGNSLYTAPAEDEALRALDAFAREVSVDPRRVTLWGASMGGAGATTVGFHRPDRFAAVVSYFGDAKYDPTGYTRHILQDEAGAHAINPIDVVDNARHLSVWLIHGERDKTSNIAQSAMLDAALRARGYKVRFDRIADAGHEGALVARFLPDVVALASEAKLPSPVTRVNYKSVRREDTDAYGVHIERAGVGDAYVDVQRRGDHVLVRRAEGVRLVQLEPGALGFADTERPRIVLDPRIDGVEARWGNAKGAP